MSNQLKKPHLASAATLLALSCWLFPSLQSHAAEPATTPCMPECCMRMDAIHVDFLNMIKEQDTELAIQAEKIKVATGSTKQDLVEATLLLMIQQQSAQHAEMEKMLSEMKGHEAKGCCPMMRKEGVEPENQGRGRKSARGGT